MSILEKIFGWHLGKNEAENATYNHIFSIWHFVALIIIAVTITFISISLSKKKHESQKKIFKVIAWILLGLEVLRMILRTITYVCYETYLPDCRNTYNVLEIISFALCTMVTFITIVTLLIDNEKWNNFIYDSLFVLGYLCGVTALIYPDMLNTYYPIYHIANVQTIITHSILIMVPTLLITTKRFVPHIKNCWKPFIVITICAIIAKIASSISGGSFMYMNGFELIPKYAGEPLWRYLWILVLFFILWTFICYLPSVIIDLRHKRNENKNQELSKQ